MQGSQRVFVSLASLAFVAVFGVQTSRAQQDGPAAGAPSQQPPSTSAPSPTSPRSPSPSSPALGSSQAATVAIGEITDVDAKSKTISVKTSSGSEMKFKYDDDTKVSGSSKNVAGLATATGSQVTINYKKDGQSNMATSIDVSAKSSPSPSASPRSPGAPGAPTSPGSPDPTSPRDPTAPRTPGSPDGPASPGSPRP